MKSRMIISLMVIALAAALIGGATMAWFTDADDAGSATFTAGTLIIDVSDGLATFQALDTSKHRNMNPGDIYDPIVIEISNEGTKKLAWFGDWTAVVNTNDNTLSDALLDAIYIKTMKMEFLSPSGAAWEPMDQFITDGVGSGDYPGWFNTLASGSTFGVVSLRSWLDNNGMGTTPFEHMGALKPGYKYRLTVQFGFHQNADNNYQGDVAGPVTVSFSVNAQQINVDALNAFRPGFGTNHYTWLTQQIAKQDLVP